jgi:transketolase
LYSGPFALIANTVKANGVPFMQNDPSWHNRKLTKEEYEKAIS